MQKPTDLVIWLADNWPLTGLAVDYVQTGTDTADTEVTITGSKGSKRLRWTTLQPLIDVRVGYNSVAELKSHLAKQVVEWREFAKKEAKDLAEFERLKKKFT